MINDLNTKGKWKIQLTVAINFLPSKDNSEAPNRHSKSDKIKIMDGNEANEIIEELFILFCENNKEA